MREFIERAGRWLKHHPSGAALLGYAILTAAAYFPLPFFLTHYPGNGLPEYDMGQYFWNFWWTLRQLLRWESLYHSNLLFHPQGVSLALHTFHLFNTLFVLPFQALGIPQVGYHLVVFASALFSGWGVFLLCRDIGVKGRAAWIAGALFMLCPYRFGQSEHFNLLNTVPIPFYLIWMRRGLLKGNWKSLAMWGFWLFLAANTSSYYLLFLLVVSPFWALHVVDLGDFRSQWQTCLLRTLQAAVVFCLLFLPQLHEITLEYGIGEYQRSLGEQIYWSAGLLNFFFPPALTAKLTGLIPDAPDSLGGRGEFAVFPGVLIWILAAAPVFLLRRTRGRFWFAMAVLGMLLALGPVLKVVEPVFLPIGRKTRPIPLPGYGLQFVPLLGAMRTPARWGLLFQLGLILYIAVNYSRIEVVVLRRLRLRRRSALMLALLIVTVAFAENWPGPHPHSDVRPPAILARLARETPAAAVLYLPLQGPWLEGRSMFLQTLNGLPMCNGYTAFQDASRCLLNRPFLRRLTGAVSESGSWESAREDLRQMNIGWIVLHPFYDRNRDERLRVCAVLEEHFGATLYGRQDRYWIYRLAAGNPPKGER